MELGRLSLCLFCLEGLTLSSATKPRFAKKWWSLGPFASGKVEYDGDPLIPHGGARLLFETGPGSGSKSKQQTGFLSEHAVGGYVKWLAIDSKVSDDGFSHVQIPHSHIPFQSLMQSPPLGGSSDVLHVQHWTVGTLKVKTPGRYSLNCRGLHTFEIASPDLNTSSIGPLAGNIYSDGFLATPVDFTEEGTYRLLARVRGKVPLQFSCRANIIERTLQASIFTKNLPDVVNGKLIAETSPIDLRLQNLGDSWLDALAEVKQENPSKSAVHGSSSRLRLAPGAAAQLPVLVSLNGPAEEKDSPACVKFQIIVSTEFLNGSRLAEQTVPVQLRCRKSSQSALLSFLDVDKSVGVAAVLRPTRLLHGVESLPVVVTMSGVGVEPQGQADAYKMKPTPRYEGDYIFGYEDMWVLAPQRGGPHNWEDVGMRTAIRAVEVLASTQQRPRADAGRLIVHGHSRGGHGAWGLAERQPDRVLGVASACGWYSREEYGDANNLWVHETSLMHLDKVLLGLLQASVAENENSLHASNLRGMPALVRAASKDRAVPPWFSRRMARHMKEEGVNVTFEEFDQEHWWWDTKETNDGGVLHDKAMREWTQDVAAHGKVELMDLLVPDVGEFVLAVSSPEYVGRFGLQILQRESPASRAFLRVRRCADGVMKLRTVNVQRFAITANSSAATLTGGVAIVDGSTVRFHVTVGIELCKPATHEIQATTCLAQDKGACSSQSGLVNLAVGRWQSCSEGTGLPPLSRSIHLLGPIRRVFAAPWIVVIPDKPTLLETRLAAYFTTGHLIAVNTATQAMELSDAYAFRSSHRFVWLGEARRFPVKERQHWPVKLLDESERGVDEILDSASLSIGPCLFGRGHGVASIAPAGARDAESSAQLDLVVTATDPQALIDLVSFSFATNQPHTRAPMSNMLPDFLVSGPDFSWRGYGGLVAAGYFDVNWGIAANSAYFHC